MSQKDILIDLWSVMMKTFKDLKIGDTVYCIYWNEPEYTQIRIHPEETQVKSITQHGSNIRYELSNGHWFELNNELYKDLSNFAVGDFSFIVDLEVILDLVKDHLQSTNQDLEDLQKYQKELSEFYYTLVE